MIGMSGREVIVESGRLKSIGRRSTVAEQWRWTLRLIRNEQQVVVDYVGWQCDAANSRQGSYSMSEREA